MALLFVPVGSLLLVSASIFLATALFLTTVEADRPRPAAPPRRAIGGWRRQAAAAGEGLVTFLRHQPYLRELAALVGLSTAAVLVTDYLFKSVAAATLPPAALGLFFARAYAVFNAVSLAVQLFVAGRVLRRLGVVPALVVLPLLLLAGGSGIAVFGGILGLALFTKGADGALRYSLHRVAGELLWMPLSGEARDRGKALLDSVFGRAVQALTAGALLLLAAFSVRSPRVLAVIVVVLAAAWLYVVARLRRSYLDLFRQALAKGTLDASAASPRSSTITSVETVMDALSSRDARAASSPRWSCSTRRAARGWSPGSSSTTRAPRCSSARSGSSRPPSARTGPRSPSGSSTHPPPEGVRVEALRALANIHHHVAVVRALEDESPAVRAHAAFWSARDGERGPHENVRAHPRAPRALRRRGGRKAPGRRLLTAIRERARPALRRPRDRDPPRRGAAGDGEVDLGLHAAEAMARVKDPRFVPLLIAAARPASRGAPRGARGAGAHQGEPALEALVRRAPRPRDRSRAPAHPPAPVDLPVRASQRAADALAEHLSDERSGAVRNQSLRGLGRAAAEAAA